MGHVLYGVRLIWDNVLGQLGHVLYETRSGTTGTRGTRLIWDTFWDTWGNRGKRGKWGKSDSGYVLFGVNAKAQSFPSGDKMIWGISVYRRVALGFRASLRTSVGCRPLIPTFGVLSGRWIYLRERTVDGHYISVERGRIGGNRLSFPYLRRSGSYWWCYGS